MFMQARRPWGIVAAILGIAVGFSPAWGQRLIVVTEARNALGETARLQAHSVDLDYGDALPGLQVLPGTAQIAPLRPDHSGRGVFASTGQPWNGDALEPRHRDSALASFRAAPFDRWPSADDGVSPGWRTQAVAAVRDDRTLSYLLVSAGMGLDSEGAWQGRLESRPWPPEGTPGRVQAEGGVTALQVAPRFTLPLWGSVLLAVGATAEGNTVALQRADAAAGTAEAPQTFTAGGHPSAQRNLSGALRSPDTTIVWILFSSLSGEAPASWLYAVETRTLAVLGPPLELPGVARADRAHLAADLRGDCWVATRTPGTDFGQITRARLAGEAGARRVEQAQSFALVGVQRHVALAADIISGDLLVAIDHRLEYWPNGERAGHGHNYGAPIATLAWTDAGPVIGEGNRLHRVALPGGTPEATVALQSGWVADALWIPAEALPAPDSDADGLDDETERHIQTRPDNPDTDGDGIPDGSDPHPKDPSPWLEVGAEVVFPYTAVGRQLRALKIESHGAPDAQWQIHLDQEALPWLRIHPRNFRGSGQAYLGVDPERFDPGGVTSGTIEVTLAGKPRGNRPGYTAAYSPATVHVRVEPPRDALRTILWLWPAAEGTASFRDASDPQGLRAFGNLASGYPDYFSMVEHFGPLSAPLDDYTLVVVPARAAAEGALTQKALFDYLSDGGAVLFLGEYLEGAHYRDLGAWLAPLGVQIDMGSPILGRFPAPAGSELLRHWDNFTLEQGCGLVAGSPGDITIPAGATGGHVFVARTHGYGRIALLSSATPLESPALAEESNRAFTQDLLYWLGRAGYAVDDRDGDGLLDATEDANDNGAFDVGETNWLDPDTDGDGIPDGMEDVNRNGVVDQGETDPRNADTDGDGVQDGADGTPVG